jgi:hypothetical protein
MSFGDLAKKSFLQLREAPPLIVGERRQVVVTIVLEAGARHLQALRADIACIRPEITWNISN